MHRAKISKKLDKLVRNMPTPMPVNERGDFDVTDLTPNSYLKINDDVYAVEKIFTYTDSEGWEWFDLMIVNIKNGDVVYLSWEDDDGIEMSLYTKEIDTEELGIREGDSIPGKIKFAGSKFKRKEHDYCTLIDGSRKSACEYWDFKGGDNWISIEKYGEDDLEVWLGREMDEDEMEVLSIGSKEGDE